MARTKFAQIWNKVTGKYVGFMDSPEDAEKWRKKQANKDDLEVNDQRPSTFSPLKAAVQHVDEALDTAIAKVKAEKEASDAG